MLTIGTGWLALLVAWSLFSWLLGASWVGPAVIALLLPVILGIVLVWYAIDWAAGKTGRL